MRSYCNPKSLAKIKIPKIPTNTVIIMSRKSQLKKPTQKIKKWNNPSSQPYKMRTSNICSNTKLRKKRKSQRRPISIKQKPLQMLKRKENLSVREFLKSRFRKRSRSEFQEDRDSFFRSATWGNRVIASWQGHSSRPNSPNSRLKFKVVMF